MPPGSRSRGLWAWVAEWFSKTWNSEGRSIASRSNRVVFSRGQRKQALPIAGTTEVRGTDANNNYTLSGALFAEGKMNRPAMKSSNYRSSRFSCRRSVFQTPARGGSVVDGKDRPRRGNDLKFA